MKIWLDKENSAPEGYIHCHSEEMAIAWIKNGDEHFERCVALGEDDSKKSNNGTKSAFYAQADRFNTSVVSIGNNTSSDKIMEYLKTRGRECQVEFHHFI